MKTEIISEQKRSKLIIDIEKEAGKYILVWTIQPGYSVYYLFARKGLYHKDVFEKFLEEKEGDIISSREFSRKELLENGRHLGVHVKVRGGGWIDYENNTIILSGRSGQYGYADREILEKIKKEFEEEGVEIETR